MKEPESNPNNDEPKIEGQLVDSDKNESADHDKGEILAKSALARLERLQKKIHMHQFMTTTEGSGKSKKEVPYSDTEEGRSILAEIQQLKEKYKDDPLFKEYEDQKNERLKEKKEKMIAGILARKLKQEMELEHAKEELKNHTPESFNENEKAVILELSPEEMEQGEEQRQSAIKRQTKEDEKQKIRWWQFWKY